MAYRHSPFSQPPLTPPEPVLLSNNNNNNKENYTPHQPQQHQYSNKMIPQPVPPPPPSSYPLPPSPTKQQSTTTGTNGYVSHYTRPMAKLNNQNEPTMTQLLASQPTSLAHYSKRGGNGGGDGDSTMGNATGLLSWRKGQGFKEWEKLKLNSNEVKRKADVAQLCKFLQNFLIV